MKLRKLAITCLSIITALTLAGCRNSTNSAPEGNNNSSSTKISMTNSLAEKEYTKTANQLASVIQTVAASNLALDSNVNTAAKKANKKMVTYNNGLRKYKQNNNYKLIKRFNEVTTAFITDNTKANRSTSYQKDFDSVAQANTAAYKGLNIVASPKLVQASTDLDKTIAKQPGVSGRTIRTTNYKISITSAQLTPHLNSDKKDIVVYYTFKNISKNKYIKPSEALANITSFTQNNKAAVTELNPGNPEDYTDEWTLLLNASHQRVKPGSTTKCIMIYALDNTDYPVKINVIDSTNDTVLGTITLDLNN